MSNAASWLWFGLENNLTGPPIARPSPPVGETVRLVPQWSIACLGESLEEGLASQSKTHRGVLSVSSGSSTVWGKPILVALLVCGFQARLWVQLMRELRNGVKLKKVQQKQFDPLPTEYQLTPFEMLMQDIRARNYKLRKVMVRGTGTVSSLFGATRWPWAAWPLSGAFLFAWAWPLISLKMGRWQPFPLNLTKVTPKAEQMDRTLERSRNLSQVTPRLLEDRSHCGSLFFMGIHQVDGDIPPRVKKDAHELILDFIRSRPPLRQVSRRSAILYFTGGCTNNHFNCFYHFYYPSFI